MRMVTFTHGCAALKLLSPPPLAFSSSPLLLLKHFFSLQTFVLLSMLNEKAFPSHFTPSASAPSPIYSVFPQLSFFNVLMNAPLKWADETITFSLLAGK